MPFTTAEREARHNAILDIIKKDHLMAPFLIGDTNVGNGFLGDLRYYTDNFIIHIVSPKLNQPQKPDPGFH